MSAPKHLRGPVIAVGYYVEYPDDDTPDLCRCDPASMGQDGLTDRQIRERAERIAACWNACQGIPTEKLHAAVLDGGFVLTNVPNKTNRGPKKTTTQQQLEPADRMLNIDDVSQLVRKSRSWIHARVKANAFAKPIRLSQRCTLWRHSDVAAWIANASSIGTEGGAA